MERFYRFMRDEVVIDEKETLEERNRRNTIGHSRGSISSFQKKI